MCSSASSTISRDHVEVVRWRRTRSAAARRRSPPTARRRCRSQLEGSQPAPQVGPPKRRQAVHVESEAGGRSPVSPWELSAPKSKMTAARTRRASPVGRADRRDHALRERLQRLRVEERAAGRRGARSASRSRARARSGCCSRAARRVAEPPGDVAPGRGVAILQADAGDRLVGPEVVEGALQPGVDQVVRREARLRLRREHRRRGPASRASPRPGTARCRGPGGSRAG